MDMDWEPEVPGQWNTPRRIRYQRIAARAVFDSRLHVEAPAKKDSPIDWQPEIPGQFDATLRISRKRPASDSGLTETISDTSLHTAAIKIQSVFPNSDYFAPIANILAHTFRIIHQIYSATLIGVGGSRKVVEIRTTTSNGSESVKRRVVDSSTTRSGTIIVQQDIRKTSTVVQPKSHRLLHLQAGTCQMETPAVPSVKASTSLDTSVPEKPSPAEVPLEQTARYREAQIPSPKHQPIETPVDREALGAKLWASFTPRPIPGSREMLVISQESASVPPTDQQPNLSSNIESTAVKPLVEKPNSLKCYNILSSEFGRIDQRTKPSLKSLPIEYESQTISSNTRKRSSRLPKWASLPQISAPEIHGLPTRSNSVSATPKQVRFAMNDTNGLPQEYSVRFYKDSKIGEWAPSSPWADDQVLACTSDLKSNLEALLREDSWMPPPSTPLALKKLEEFYSAEDSSSIWQENVSSSPPTTELPSQVLSNSISSVLADSLDNSDQVMTDEQQVDEVPNFRASTVSSVTDTPYTRIKELVKGSFRRVFSASLRATNTESIDANPSAEAAGLSIESLDTSSQIEGYNQPSSRIVSPKVLDYRISKPNEGRGYASNENEYKSVLLDSPIEIGGNDGTQSPSVENSNGDSGRHSIRSDGSNDSPITSQEEDNPVDAELELVMKTLKMSTFSEEKIRKKRAAAAAARRATEEAAAAKAKAEAQEAERKARFHRRMPKEKLVKPLSKDWEAKVREALGRGDNVALTTTATGTELRRRDFMTVLGERQWLNDEIINAYIEWVVEYANKKAGRDGRNAIPKVVAHNSFFYKNLSENGAKSVSRWMKRKKAEGKKLFEVETVLIPVNNASHWTILVVSPMERTIEYLDSFSGAGKVFVKHAKGWLKEELGDAWREEEWRVLQTRSAVQNNGYDCGVFCITNAECVAGGVDTSSYDGDDMADQRQRIAGVLLNRGFGGEFIPAEDL